MNETLAFSIVKLYKDFLEYTKKELKAFGLNFGQMPVILYIGKHPNCTQSCLTKELSLDWGYSQRSVQKLCDTGFIEKSFLKEKNCNCLTLTDKGNEAFEICHSVFSSWDAIKMQNFNFSQKNDLLSLIAKISAEKEGKN